MIQWYQIDEIHRTIKQNLARGCFWPVYWNNHESNLTRPCSNTQVQNNSVSIDWLQKERMTSERWNDFRMMDDIRMIKWNQNDIMISDWWNSKNNQTKFSTGLFWTCILEQPWVKFDTPLFQYTVPEQPRVNWMTSER